MSDDGEAIQARKLPNRRPDRTWGGPGAGGPCTICGTAVKTDEAELELEFNSDDGIAPEGYHVHASCFAVWDLERAISDELSQRPAAGGSDGGQRAGSAGSGHGD